jgi:hypothetical protein
VGRPFLRSSTTLSYYIEGRVRLLRPIVPSRRAERPRPAGVAVVAVYVLQALGSSGSTVEQEVGAPRESEEKLA